MVSRKLIAIVLIVAMVGGGAGVYLVLAAPTPVFSASVDLSGVLVDHEYTFTVFFPSSQMQISTEITSNTGIFVVAVFNSTGDPVYSSGILPASGTVMSAWLPASGAYTLSIIGTLAFTGVITVYKRGVPFIV